MRKRKIEFAPSDKIDDFAYELVKDVFSVKGALITNESTLEDFESLGSIPGHKLISLSKVPKSQQHLYKRPTFPTNRKNYLVWYPPVSDEEWQKIRKLFKLKLLKKVENKYKISTENYPHNEPLYVWKMAKFVKSKLRES